MAIIKTLDILLRGQTGRLGRDLKKGSSLVNSFASSIKSKLSGVGIALAGAAGVGSIGALFTLPAVAAARLEQTAVAFKVLTGSAESAQRLLKELQGFAASTPFQFPELANASRLLLAFGVSAGEITDNLKRIGDISSGIGAPVGEIAELFGKAKVQGTLFAEDINQLVGRGIPVIQEFAKQLGVSEGEVKKLGSQGKITFANLNQAFIDLTSEGGAFFNMMQEQSQTTIGKFSTLKDNILAAALPIGEAMLPAINAILDVVSQLLPLVQTMSVEFSAWVSQISLFQKASVDSMSAFIGGIDFANRAWNAMKGAIITTMAVAAGLIAEILNGLAMVEQGLIALGGNTFDFGLANLAAKVEAEAFAIGEKAREKFGLAFGENDFADQFVKRNEQRENEQVKAVFREPIKPKIDFGAIRDQAKGFFDGALTFGTDFIKSLGRERKEKEREEQSRPAALSRFSVEAQSAINQSSPAAVIAKTHKEAQKTRVKQEVALRDIGRSLATGVQGVLIRLGG